MEDAVQHAPLLIGSDDNDVFVIQYRILDDETFGIETAASVSQLPSSRSRKIPVCSGHDRSVLRLHELENVATQQPGQPPLKFVPNTDHGPGISQCHPPFDGFPVGSKGVHSRNYIIRQPESISVVGMKEMDTHEWEKKNEIE